MGIILLYICIYIYRLYNVISHLDGSVANLGGQLLLIRFWDKRNPCGDTHVVRMIEQLQNEHFPRHPKLGGCTEGPQ